MGFFYPSVQFNFWNVLFASGSGDKYVMQYNTGDGNDAGVRFGVMTDGSGTFARATEAITTGTFDNGASVKRWCWGVGNRCTQRGGWFLAVNQIRPAEVADDSGIPDLWQIADTGSVVTATKIGTLPIGSGNYAAGMCWSLWGDFLCLRARPIGETPTVAALDVVRFSPQGVIANGFPIDTGLRLPIAYIKNVLQSGGLRMHTGGYYYFIFGGTNPGLYRFRLSATAIVDLELVLSLTAAASRYDFAIATSGKFIVSDQGASPATVTLYASVNTPGAGTACPVSTFNDGGSPCAFLVTNATRVEQFAAALGEEDMSSIFSGTVRVWDQSANLIDSATNAGSLVGYYSLVAGSGWDGQALIANADPAGVHLRAIVSPLVPP